jgi:hypothetical protein
MKPLVLAVAALGLMSTSFSSGAISEGIQRCRTADGSAIYTDKACGSLGASNAPLSAELLTRIAMDTMAEPTVDSLGVAYRDASEPLVAPAAARRSLSGGCARSPRQLSADLVGAFALHDVNRIAESYHWAGMGHRQAMGVMQRLERLSSRPLAEAKFLAAWVGSGDTSADEIPADSGLMQLVFAGDGLQVVDLQVRKYSGCYFVRLG